MWTSGPVTFWLLDTLIQYGRIVSVLPLRLRELSRDTIIAVLRQLAKNCNFGQLKASLIRNPVVVDVKDGGLREEFLTDKTPTFNKCLQKGRAHELSKHHMKIIFSTVNATNPRLNRVTKSTYKKYQHKKKIPGKKSKWCGMFTFHSSDHCPPHSATRRRRCCYIAEFKSLPIYDFIPKTYTWQEKSCIRPDVRLTAAAETMNKMYLCARGSTQSFRARMQEINSH